MKIFKYKKEESIFYNSKLLPIAKMGVFLGLLIFIKWKLGMANDIDGIEIVTGFFMVLCLFIIKKEVLFLTTGFILLCLPLYGFRTCLGYFIGFNSIAFLTIIFRKFLHKYYFLIPLWAFLCSFSVWLWFFPLDWVMLGWKYAILSVSTALPINFIEGTTNFLFVALTYPIFNKIFMYKKNWIAKNIYQYLVIIKSKNKVINYG